MKTNGNGDHASKLKMLVLGRNSLLREGLCRVVKGLHFAPEIEEADGLDDLSGRIDGLDTRYDLVFLSPAATDIDPDSFAEVRDALPNTPVAVLGLEESSSQIRAALSAGAAGYIPVMSPPQVIVHAVELMLAGSRYVPAAAFDPDPAGTSLGELVAGNPRLTERQTAVLQQLSKGFSNKQIAANLDLSEATVKVHVAAIMRALNARNRTQAVLIATESGVGLDQEARGAA